ncbi:MAG: LytTR family DNA-binding domain-containing protein [Acidobacteriota bacterium]
MSASGLRFGRYLLAAGLVVSLLFTVVAPAASAGFNLPGRFLYWTLHTFGALAALAVAQSALGRSTRWRRRPWLATLIAGVLGAWLFAPFALGLEQILGLVPEPDGDPLDAWALRWGLAGALTVEALELTAPVAATWVALNMPWLLRLDFTPSPGPAAPELRAQAIGGPGLSPDPDAVGAEPAAPKDATPSAPEPIDEPSRGPAAARAPRAATRGDAPRDEPEDGDDGFIDLLPAALGRDVAALSSQLHYLEVHTTRGRTLVLYNLKDAVGELEPVLDGLQIHRSHWVADAHVRRLARRSGGWVCELTTGLELPVSRRRAPEAKRRWGAGATYRAAGAAAT